VAAVAVKKGLTQKYLTVKMPGGEMKIEIEEQWDIRMTGDVSEIANGFLSRELVAELMDSQ
jgi:diaminopimelate epimerase